VRLGCDQLASGTGQAVARIAVRRLEVIVPSSSCSARPLIRRSRAIVSAAAASLTLTFAAPLLTSAPAAAAPSAAAASAPTPGIAGKTITLANHVDLDGGSDDIAIDRAGTAYVGWIADSDTKNPASRRIYLCVLPLHAMACKGGIHSAPSLDASGASDLKVLAAKNGKVTLVWFDNVLPDSETGPNGSQITESTVQQNGTLSAAEHVASAPSFGEMLDAELGPNGSIWTVAAGDGELGKIQVHEGLSSPAVTIKTPFNADFGLLAFAGSKPIIAIHHAGQVSDPVAYSSLSGHSWHKFAHIKGTWTSDANFGMASTRSGVRLIATINNANYYPVVAKWNGHSFTKRTQIGDHNNDSPSSHDVVADASGRLADVATEGSKLAIDNLPDTKHAGIVRIPFHGTIAGNVPQLGTTPRGDGWLAWSVEAGGSKLGDKLMVVAVRLPGLHHSKSAHGSDGRVTVTGPASCLPDATISVGVIGQASHGWHVSKHSLRLSGKKIGSVLNGAALTPGKKYRLKGKVTFAGGGAHQTVAVTLKFRACPKP
jgi:hypothetical protein